MDFFFDTKGEKKDIALPLYISKVYSREQKATVISYHSLQSGTQKIKRRQHSSMDSINEDNNDGNNSKEEEEEETKIMSKRKRTAATIAGSSLTTTTTTTTMSNFSKKKKKQRGRKEDSSDVNDNDELELELELELDHKIESTMIEILIKRGTEKTC
jgi:hypothetical protein